MTLLTLAALVASTLNLLVVLRRALRLRGGEAPVFGSLREELGRLGVAGPRRADHVPPCAAPAPRAIRPVGPVAALAA